MVSALQDIYDVIASGSAKLQDLQAFPWDRKQAFVEMLEVLGDMSDDLDEATGVQSDSKLWSTLRKRPNCGKQVSSPSQCVGIPKTTNVLQLAQLWVLTVK